MLTPREAGTIVQALRLMGCSVATLRDIQAEQDPATRVELLEAWRAEAKQAYRAAVLEHHPDRGGDPEKLVLLNAGWELIERMQVHPPAPLHRPARPAPRVVVHFYGVSGVPGSTYTPRWGSDAGTTTSSFRWTSTLF